MPWPTGQEYNEAIQAPKLSLTDPVLKDATVECNQLGLPKPRTGAFATVYKLSKGSQHWAVRCFNREIPDQQDRYLAISQYLRTIALPYTANFEFQPTGILVRGGRYPILKMEWFSGEPLNIYVEKHLNDTAALLQLAAKWVGMTTALRQAGVAHGDLQHGNVLLVGNELKLVDYDGMYVPNLNGKRSNETGQPNYQLPRRNASDFGPYLDNFSEWVVLVSLLALTASPGLWQQFRGGDECLLFRKRDFEDPDQSQLFHALERLPDQRLVAVVSIFRSLLFLSPAMVPPIDTTYLGTPTTPIEVGRSAGSDWLRDHVSSSQSAKNIGHQTVPQTNAQSWVLDFTSPPPVPLQFTSSFTDARLAFTASLLCTGLIVSLSYLAGLGAVISFALVSFILFKHYYRSLPEVQGARELVAELVEKKHNVQSTLDELMKFERVKEQIRKDEFERFQDISSRKSGLLRDDNRRRAEVQRKHNDQLISLQAQLKGFDSSEQADLSSLQKGLGAEIATLKATLAAITARENTEISVALQKKQEAFVRDVLMRTRIYDAPLHNIGSGYKKRLYDGGIRTAYDVNYNVGRVKGIGASRSATLIAWRGSLESAAKAAMPRSLSAQDEQAVRNPHAFQRERAATELLSKEPTFLSQESAIKARYGEPKSKVIAQLSQAQIALQRDLSVVAGDTRSKDKQFADEELRANEEANRKVADVERQMEEGRRRLSAAQWQAGKVQRLALRYSRLSFALYVRRVVFWR